MANSLLFVTTPSYMKGYRTDIQVGVGDVIILYSLDLTADSSGKPITLPSCTPPSYTPIVLCRNLKAHQTAWFYCQKATLYHHAAWWLSMQAGCRRDGWDCGGLVIRSSIQSCHALSSHCFKRATPQRRCILQDFWMPVGGGGGGRKQSVPLCHVKGW